MIDSMGKPTDLQLQNSRLEITVAKSNLFLLGSQLCIIQSPSVKLSVQIKVPVYVYEVSSINNHNKQQTVHVAKNENYNSLLQLKH